MAPKPETETERDLYRNESGEWETENPTSPTMNPLVSGEVVAEIEEIQEEEHALVNSVRQQKMASSVTSILVSLQPFDFEITITNLSRKNKQRQLLWSDEYSRNLAGGSNSSSPNYAALDLILEDYLNDFFRTEFKNNPTIYTPFDRVILNRQEDVVSASQAKENIIPPGSDRRLQMDGIFNYFNDEENVSYLRARQLFSSTKTLSYEGVSIFIQEGALPEPSSGLVENIQIKALNTDKDALLNAMNKPSVNLGPGNLITSYKTSLATTPGPAPASSNSKSLDTVILIAIIVAVLSMLLLSFALYLAFRRRKKNETKYPSPTKTKSMEGAMSFDKNDVNSPDANLVTSPNAPAQVIATSPISDDNISDYTDSIVTDSEARMAREKAERIVAQRNNQMKQKHEHEKKKAAAPVRISSRFNPRYVNKMEANESLALSPISSSTPSNTYANGVNKHSVSSGSRSNRIGPTDHSTMDGGMSFNKDDHSLSSMESYGYSLDGIGDYSTVAGSTTRYGY